MDYVCIAAHGSTAPGRVVEVPDGAEPSPLHFALPGSPEALAAEQAAGAAQNAPADPPGPPAPDTTPEPSVPVLSAPGGAA